MRGQLQAMSIVSACAVLALALMPLSWPIGYLSAAAVGLVTLVQGPLEGGKTAFGATVLLALAGLLIMGSPAVAVAFALSLWLPAWLLSCVLWLGRSLVVPIQALLVLGLGVLLAIYGILGDPAAWWHNHIMNNVLPALEQANVAFEQGPTFEAHLTSATKVMTGVLAMVSIWGMVAGLLIARWWQALLYRPGAFAEEFRALRLGKPVALAGVVLVVLTLLTDGRLAELTGNMLLVVIAVALLQGLAVAHALVARFKAHHVWLAMLYLTLVFLMPYVLLMVAMTGLVDNWADFRTRFQARA